MLGAKSDIITQLEKEILSLQGYKQVKGHVNAEVELGPIMYSFPNAIFPLGAIHEFIAEDIAATGGFVAGIVSSLMQNEGASVWVSASRTIFPPALRLFGISPEKIAFIDLKKERDVLWGIEEALKCNGLAAVVGEVKDLSFTTSRRLQLAVEQSQVTGFILRHPRQLNTTACITRWKITSLPSEATGGMPGIGYPRWNVELLKVRNGKPGSWQVEWAEGKFRPVYEFASLMPEPQKKAG